MIKATIVLLAVVGSALSLKFGDPGTPGVTFEQHGAFFEEVIVDESIVAPGSRVIVAIITDVTGEPSVGTEVGGGGFGTDPLNPKIEGSDGSYSLSIEVPEHESHFPGAPDPQHFVEIFEGTKFPVPITIIFKNVPGSGPIHPGGPLGPGSADRN